MITAYFLRAIAIGALVGIGASLVDAAFAASGRPRRFVWLVALALAAVVPAAGIARLAGEAGTPAAVHPAMSSLSSREGGVGGAAARGGTTARSELAVARTIAAPSAASRWTLPVPAWLREFDRPVAALWLAASLLWSTILIGSALRIHRSRRRWREAVIDGMPVYVSHDEGPALFGLTRFGIVVPAWVTGLDPVRRRLIIAHEREHARAADPVTLLAGAIFVMLQPLNPAAWMMFRRLRLAIEIDCDARVIAHAGDVRTYGELLIDVGERTLAGAAPLAALSEGGSQLERRIRALSQPKGKLARLRTVGALAAGAVLGIAAWRLPLPAVAAAQESPGKSGVDTANSRPSSKRAIVRVNSLGLHDAGPRPTILVWSEGGPVRLAIGTDSLRPLVDTVRLDRLPAMRFDVTDGQAMVAVEGRGTLLLGAEVEGGAAKRFSAAGHRIGFLRGGRGVSNGDDGSPYIVDLGDDALETVSDDVLWRLLEEQFPALVDGPLGPEPYVWLLIDGKDRLIGSNRGLGDLPRRADGKLESLQSSRVRKMLPGMSPQLRRGEAWGWRKLSRESGDTLNVIWVRQLYDASSEGPR